MRRPSGKLSAVPLAQTLLSCSVKESCCRSLPVGHRVQPPTRRWSLRSAVKWTADEGRSRSAEKGNRGPAVWELVIGTRRETAHRLRPRAAARSSKLILINSDQKSYGRTGGPFPAVVPVHFPLHQDSILPTRRNTQQQSRKIGARGRGVKGKDKVALASMVHYSPDAPRSLNSQLSRPRPSPTIQAWIPSKRQAN